MTIVCATNEGLYATCSACAPGFVRFTSTNKNAEKRSIELPFNVAELSIIASTNVSNDYNTLAHTCYYVYLLNICLEFL